MTESESERQKERGQISKSLKEVWTQAAVYQLIHSWKPGRGKGKDFKDTPEAVVNVVFLQPHLQHSLTTYSIIINCHHSETCKCK